MLKDYERVLQNLDQVEILKPNDAFILKMWGDMKQMLYDYEITLQDLDKLNIVEWNDASILKAQENVKLKFKKLWNQILLDLDKIDVLQSN